MKKITFNISIAFLAVLVSFAGIDKLLNQYLMDYRFALAPKPASGKIAFIAIDHKSLRELSQWPWPRSTHARLIEKLHGLETAEIAFDIDFSSKTTAKEDQAFADALKAGNGSIILPTFRQYQLHGNRAPDLVHAEPLEMFSKHAWLASVNVYPTRNGRVETMPYGHYIDQTFIPSLASLITGVYQPNAAEFLIDHSIQTSTIPTFSYVDVLNGRVNPNLLKGRKIIIGANAASLGDTILVPGQGIVAGPELQILAAETLIQGRSLIELTPLAIWLGVAFIGIMMCTFGKSLNLASRAIIYLISAIGMEIGAFIILKTTGIILETALWQIVLLAYLTATLLHDLDLKQIVANMAEGRLSETQQMFRQVFNDSFTGSLIANEKGIICAASKAIPTLLQTPENTIFEGNHYRHFLPEQIASTANQLLKETYSSNKTKNLTSITDHTRPDGKTITLEYTITISALDDEQAQDQSERRIISIALQDITARQMAEQAQQEVIEAAIQSDKAKTDFLANISHELRTPLNSILGFSELIETQALGPDRLDDYSDYARDIKASGQQLLRIVNDILFLTRVDSGQIWQNDESCNVMEHIEYAIEDISRHFRGRSLNIAVEADEHLPALKADPKFLHEILTAILSNAVKFSNEEDEILIRALQNQDGKLVLSIRDHGVGISHSELNSIFKPFYQIDNDLNRQFEGAGLGLTKANSLMRSHGGTLKIASRLSEGTTIYLTFPEDRCQIASETVIGLHQGPSDYAISA